MTKTADPYFAIADQYRALFLQGDGDAFLFQIGKFRGVRGVLVHVYSSLVQQKECLPIEKLPQHEKIALWEEAKRVTDSKDQKTIIETAKALHALGTYLQL